MRTNRIFAIAAAVAALAACTKNEQPENINEGDGPTFQKGQEVTLIVNASNNTNPGTKVTSGWSSDRIVFNWEEGDQIKVTVGEESGTFTLVSGAGTPDGTFSGKMPSGGSSFDVQYPVQTPDLSTQTYSATEPIPHNKMLFTATGCSIDTPFTLEPQYSAICVNLYGLDAKVTELFMQYADDYFDPQIMGVIELDCSSSQKIGKEASAASPFYVVIPSGTLYFLVGFKGDIVKPLTDINGTLHYVENGDQGVGVPIIPALPFESYQTFSSGSVLSMPAKCITLVWAPVNCGYDAGHPNGLYYQWGRKYGLSPDSYSVATLTMAQGQDSAHQNEFGKEDSSTINWFSGDVVDTLWNSGTVSAPVKTIYDPCPVGWRIPTKEETSNSFTTWYYDDEYGAFTVRRRGSWNSTKKGWDFDDLFLPGIGEMSCWQSGMLYQNEIRGYYWSSTHAVDYEEHPEWAVGGSFDGSDNTVGEIYQGRANACPIRCVLE